MKISVSYYFNKHYNGLSIKLLCLFNNIISKKYEIDQDRIYDIEDDEKIQFIQQYAIDKSDLSISELNEYNAYIAQAAVNSSDIKVIILYRLYLDAEDKQFLKNALLRMEDGCREILWNDDIAGCLAISDEEYIHCIDMCLTNKYLFSKVLEKHYQRLTSKHINYLLSFYYLQSYEGSRIIANKDIDVNFRLRLMQSIADKNSYKIAIEYMHKDDNPTIREIIFNYLIKNTSFDFFEKNLKFFTDNELQQLYDLYHDQLFGNSKKYNEYFARCVIFGRILKEDERKTLIKRMKTKTRHFDIPHALLNINFNEDEVNQLQAIQLMYDLRSA